MKVIRKSSHQFNLVSLIPIFPLISSHVGLNGITIANESITTEFKVRQLDWISKFVDVEVGAIALRVAKLMGVANWIIRHTAYLIG